MSRPTQSSANIYTVIVRDEFIYACASGCLNAVNRVLEYNPTTCFLAELDIAFKCALAGEHDNILLWMWSHNPNVGGSIPSSTKLGMLGFEPRTLGLKVHCSTY